MGHPPPALSATDDQSEELLDGPPAKSLIVAGSLVPTSGHSLLEPLAKNRFATPVSASAQIALFKNVVSQKFALAKVLETKKNSGKDRIDQPMDPIKFECTGCASASAQHQNVPQACKQMMLKNTNANRKRIISDLSGPATECFQ